MSNDLDHSLDGENRKLLSRREMLGQGGRILVLGTSVALLDSITPAVAQSVTRRVTVHSLIVRFAQGKLGQQVRGGECTDLVDAAFSYARAKPGRNYVWGAPVGGTRKGFVIQFWDAHFTGPNSTWGTAPGGKHTAIIETANGTAVTLLHQNDGQRVVTRRTLDLAWRHTGSYQIYYPLPL